MTAFIRKFSSFNGIEFWTATIFFVFTLFFFATQDAQDLLYEAAPLVERFKEAGISFNVYNNYLFPLISRFVLFYGAFIAVNFYIVPPLVQGYEKWEQIGLLLLVFVLGGMWLGVSDTYLKAYLSTPNQTLHQTHVFIFKHSFLYALWLLLIMLVYSIVKYIGLHLLANSKTYQQRHPLIRHEGIVSMILWAVGLLLLMLAGADKVLAVAWVVCVPFGILFYLFCFRYLMPASLPKKRPLLQYLLRAAGVLIISWVPVTLLLFLFLYRYHDAPAAISFINAMFHLFVTAPITWYVYKRNLKGSEEVYALKTKLGQSTAKLDFLRSQINPHFLFNALNTIYGTALQEGAERTGEGIEKLGDMMRFMLNENMQDSIPLAREVEYVNNYIALQKLRTNTSPSVQITTYVPEQHSHHQIAPMLLIPFVENAFKHGISLRQPSYLKISLEVKNGALYFDVSNSKHERQATDPESNNSGVGLQNVKQRLALLYPNQHQLIIRETSREFFIHLTLQLSAAG